jgi:hypothetical protein
MSSFSDNSVQTSAPIGRLAQLMAVIKKIDYE